MCHQKKCLEKLDLKAVSTWNSDIPILLPSNCAEIKPVSILVQVPTSISEWIVRFSSYSRMLVVVGWVRQFIPSLPNIYKPLP